MVSSRTRRRRRSIALTLGAVLTLLIIIFAHDVTRAAHDAVSVRKSEDTSFAALANALVVQENLFDVQLNATLDQSSETRGQLLVALTSYRQQLTQWANEAALLPGPHLSGAVDTKLSIQTLQRVAAYRSLLATVATTLSLPWSSTPSMNPGEAQATLRSSADTWGSERHVLASGPAKVTMLALTKSVASTNFSTVSSALASDPLLTLVRNFSVAAVEVQPAPLPSATGVLNLPPATAVDVTVAVDNRAVDNQALTLSVTLTSSTGRSQTSLQSQLAGPTADVGFATSNFIIYPGERGQLRIQVTGGGVMRSKTYHLVVAAPGVLG